MPQGDEPTIIMPLPVHVLQSCTCGIVGVPIWQSVQGLDLPVLMSFTVPVPKQVLQGTFPFTHSELVHLTYLLKYPLPLQYLQAFSPCMGVAG